MTTFATFLIGLLAGITLTGWAYEYARMRRERAISRALDSVRRDLETDGEELLRRDARRRREIGL